ncbi:MAG: DUF402 domain-containing protein [Chloroflexi bacterium]|nr:DUF402 domain-containing protein [Chloroflexota bacterium]
MKTHSLRAGDRVAMRKLKYRGENNLWTTWRWHETVWHAADDFFVTFEEPGIPFLRADETWHATRYAFFYVFPRASFNLLELYTNNAARTFEGWYLNINTPPQRTADEFAWIDLDLDLWLYPDLSYEILDEDEFHENAARYHYTSEMHRIVAETLAHLLDRIRRVELPFRRNVTQLGPEIEFLATYFNALPPKLQSPISNRYAS